MSEIFQLGLTGGIGSGKSTVAAILADIGAAVADADAIARQTCSVGGAAIPAISDMFGTGFLTKDGALDREKMRAHAFHDKTALKTLEAIIHPLVGLEIQAQVIAAANRGCRCIVLDIPLLVESGRWASMVDHVLVVDCSAEIQLNRVIARSQLARQEVEKIIASQASREHRLGSADTVVCNVNLSIPELKNEVLQISHRFGLSSQQPTAKPDKLV